MSHASDKTIYVPVYCKIVEMKPDIERFKPAATIIQFDITVLINVPLRAKYVVNTDRILQAQLTNEKEPDPIFTIHGLRYIEKELLSRQEPEKENGNISWTEDEFEDFE